MSYVCIVVSQPDPWHDSTCVCVYSYIVCPQFAECKSPLLLLCALQAQELKTGNEANKDWE